MKHGEQRLLAAVEAGHMPMGIAIQVARAPQDEQRILREAYESKQLRGGKLLMVKRLIEQRRRLGKASTSGTRGHSLNKATTNISRRDILKIYQREVDRKRLL